MNTPLKISFQAQTETGQLLTHGVFESEHGVCAIDPELGLAVLARGPAQTSASTLKSTEILQDDMQTNLPLSDAAECMAESLANIHEYLLNTSEFEAGKGIALIALQIHLDSLHIGSAGPFECLHVHAGHCTQLPCNSSPGNYLGGQGAGQWTPTQRQLSSGDMLLAIGSDDFAAIGDDFMHLTLERFCDNPEVALRQINTRLSRRGHQRKPTVLFASIGNARKQNRSWLGGWIAG